MAKQKMTRCVCDAEVKEIAPNWYRCMDSKLCGKQWRTV